MASNDNPRQPLINPFTSGDPSSMKYTQPSPSTTSVNMVPFPAATKGKLRDRKRKQKQSPVRDVFMQNLGERLVARKRLLHRLSALTDVMCFVGLLGVVLMVIENELTFHHLNDKDTPTTWFIKLVITLSTLVLLGLVLVYHRLDLALYNVNNGIDDWRIGLTWKRVVLIVIEIIVCAIHPIPRLYPTQDRMLKEEELYNATIPAQPPLSYLPTDVGLGLPMFARLYLLCRWMMYHSSLFHGSSSQSLGYLNKVSIDFAFLVKAYLEEWPTRSLLILSAFATVIGSWSMRACSYDPDGTHVSVADSLWLFIVTYTSIGYSDINPSTQCGRVVAMIICFLGLLAVALLITVFSQKLVLGRSEKYVYDFVSKAELEEERREEAANVVKFATKLWFLKRKGTPVTSVYWLHTQRKLFRSVNVIKQIKQEQITMIDNCVGPIELMTIQRSTNDKTETIDRKITKVEAKMYQFEEQLTMVNDTVRDMQNSLNILINRFREEKS